MSMNDTQYMHKTAIILPCTTCTLACSISELFVRKWIFSNARHVSFDDAQDHRKRLSVTAVKGTTARASQQPQYEAYIEVEMSK
jgi:hypothetical protein